MTTLVIHGTLAHGASWYWNSWHSGGFCHSLANAMEQTAGSHDVWRVNGQSVAAAGRFEWSGLAEGLYRGAAAIALVQYLNALRQRTDEPIRIVAHSHGCNVVKLASALPELSPRVHVAKAVFLACPHFWETNYVAEKPQSLADRISFRKQMLKPQGRKYRYRASPQRFGTILNLYSERDRVQVSLAESLSGGLAPQTGGILENMARMFSTGEVLEVPQADRTDSDPLAQHLYENFKMPTARTCGEIAAHSAMHGAVVATLCGAWLSSNADVASLLAEFGELPEISEADTGA